MVNNIPMPELSPNFTIEDIHKLREWNYERCKGMTLKEISDLSNKEAAEFMEYMKARTPILVK